MDNNQLWHSSFRPIFVYLEKQERKLQWYFSDIKDNINEYGIMYYILRFIPTNRANELLKLLLSIRNNTNYLSYYSEGVGYRAVVIEKIHIVNTITDLKKEFNILKYWWMTKL